MAVTRGICKWFDSKKGYGFITAEDGTDLFVHQTDIHAEGFRNLAEGEAVEFQIQTASDGRQKAVHVTGPGGAFVQGEGRRDPGRMDRGGYGEGGGGGYGNGGGYRRGGGECYGGGPGGPGDYGGRHDQRMGGNEAEYGRSGY
eukprot:XP_028343450.1 glycine-rich protein 2-like [Physeter catodon]